MQFVPKWSEELKVGDEFKLGNLLVQINSISRNNLDQMIFNLEIQTGSVRNKKTANATLILPKKLPIETLK